MVKKFNWVSSLDPQYEPLLNDLQKKMHEYYSNSVSYYSDIDYTAEGWFDENKLEYQDALEEIKNAKAVLEIGCGSANILSTNLFNHNKYTGIEFSNTLIEKNSKKYPKAKFHALSYSESFPFDDESFDLVFSFFVLEHTVYPTKFLNETIRVLKKGGLMILLCPNFLGKNILSSQRAGLSQGTGREKLKEGKIFDAILTGFESKIVIPFKMVLLKRKMNNSTKFYINLNPTCFTDNFRADVDAVYITYEREILNYLNNKINWKIKSDELEKYSEYKGHIYLKGTKVD